MDYLMDMESSYTNGDVYEGGYKDDKFHGQGKFLFLVF